MSLTVSCRIYAFRQGRRKKNQISSNSRNRSSRSGAYISREKERQDPKYIIIFHVTLLILIFGVPYYCWRPLRHPLRRPLRRPLSQPTLAPSFNGSTCTWPRQPSRDRQQPSRCHPMQEGDQRNSTQKRGWPRWQ